MHRATIFAGAHVRRPFLLTLATLAAVATGFLTPAVAAADDTYTIRVTVLSPSGAPAPGIEVVSEIPYLDARTDANGRAVFRDIDQPSDYIGFTAELDASTQHLAGPTGWAPTSGELPAPVGGVAKLTLNFAVGAAAAGTLVDDRTGAPIAGAAVLHQGWEGDFIGVDTDGNGRWLLPNLVPGDYGGPFTGGVDNAAAPHGYVQTTLGGDGLVHYTAGKIIRLGVQRLTPLVQFLGTAQVASGDGVPNAWMQIGDVDGDPSTPFRSGQDGITQANQTGAWSLTIPWSPAPHRMLCGYSELTGAHYPTGLGLRCVISNDTALTIASTLTLSGGGAVRGTVTGPAVGTGYNPAVNVRVHGEDVTVGFGSSYQSSYTVNGVPAGTRTVTLRSGGEVLGVSEPVTVRVDRTTRVPVIHTS